MVNHWHHLYYLTVEEELPMGWEVSITLDRDHFRSDLIYIKLAFIAFTEAMTHFPASPFWSVMFFLMLVNLGLGSMFGTIEGIITPVVDTFKVRKEILTGEFLCIWLFIELTAGHFTLGDWSEMEVGKGFIFKVHLLICFRSICYLGIYVIGKWNNVDHINYY